MIIEQTRFESDYETDTITIEAPPGAQVVTRTTNDPADGTVITIKHPLWRLGDPL